MASRIGIACALWLLVTGGLIADEPAGGPAAGEEGRPLTFLYTISNNGYIEPCG
ncbi:MAG: hypothetical protein ACE5GW_06230 [Planctomycetota bacterium]